MTARTPAYLKARFEQGDVPNGTDYEDVFDSYINIVTSAEQSIDSNLRTTKKFIAATVSATGLTTNTIQATAVSAGTLYSDTSKLTTVSAINFYTDSILQSASLDVSANSTTQALATTLTAGLSFITFANGGNDAVKLGTSQRGLTQFVVNAASTTLRIYPAVSGRFLVTAVNASLNIPADKCATIFHKGDDRYGIQIG